MNKKDLTVKVAKQTSLTAGTSMKVIDTVIEAIKESIEQNERVTLQGLGSFTVKQYAERKGINPSTGKSMVIPAHKVVKFVASKIVKIN